ncbi:hypothetical protein niasHT_033807 [Heterodera trifolii]|uniref:BTB domain-containing protein n=1 Tax=Heterodera trifolii TaxID=157864 RepID=A0ABD2J7F8_9BILA
MTELERLQKMNSEKGNDEKSDTLADRMKLLLSTAKFADAHFLVGQNDKKELVPAHRNILSASSDVFEAMFQNEAKENTMVQLVEKDFVQRCLAYIGKNANNLLKLKEFLQFWNETNCKSALRWADAKCREMALNVRQRIVVKCLARHCSKFAFR